MFLRIPNYNDMYVQDLEQQVYELKGALRNRDEIITGYRKSYEQLQFQNNHIKAFVASYFDYMKNRTLVYSLWEKTNAEISSQHNQLPIVSKLNTIFRYSEALEGQIVHQDAVVTQKDVDIKSLQLAKDQLEFRCKEYQHLMEYLRHIIIDSIKFESCFINNSDKGSRSYTDNQIREKLESFRNSDLLEELNKQIGSYQAQLQKKNEIIERKIQKISNLETELEDIRMKLTSIQVMSERRIKGFCKSLENITEATKSRTEALEEEKNHFKEKINSMTGLVQGYCKKYDIETLEKEANDEIIKDNFKIIDKLQADAEQYEMDIYRFKGTRDDKKYLHIKEMLIRIVEALDRIDCHGSKKILTRRKSVLTIVNGLYDKLESRVTS